MKFVLQSLNDIVTNSSMEVYQAATDYTVDAVKDIIDVILKLSGSDSRCQDLFDVEIDYEDTLWKYFEYEIDSTTLSDEDDSKVKEIIHAMSERKPDGMWWEDKERYQALVDANLVGEGKLRTIKEFIGDYEGYTDTSVTIIPKVECSQKDREILSKINRLFHIEANYDS